MPNRKTAPVLSPKQATSCGESTPPVSPVGVTKGIYLCLAAIGILRNEGIEPRKQVVKDRRWLQGQAIA